MRRCEPTRTTTRMATSPIFVHRVSSPKVGALHAQPPESIRNTGRSTLRTGPPPLSVIDRVGRPPIRSLTHTTGTAISSPRAIRTAEGPTRSPTRPLRRPPPPATQPPPPPAPPPPPTRPPRRPPPPPTPRP